MSEDAIGRSGMVLETPILPTILRRPDLELMTQINSFRSISSRSLEPRSPALLNNHKCVAWTGEERFIPPGHIAEKYVKDAWGAIDEGLLESLKDSPTVIFGIPILEVEDEAGTILRSVRIEQRVFHKDCPEEVPFHTMVILPQLGLLQRVRAHSFSNNPAMVMQHATPDRGVLERNLFLRARELVETNEAFAAFDTLFRHYSTNEELCRLDEWMKHLPYTLEEHPKMAYYREMLETQIGHLRKGAAEWYANSSPCAGIDLRYVTRICTLPGLMPVRLQWLVAECRKKGYKSVAEYGSVEGVNLFHLIQLANDIEWHGFETNLVAVARGHELAREARLGERFRLAPLAAVVVHKRQFDAVALFEVLEHNSEEEGAKVLRDAESLVRPGGEVFITTPWGNWSAWDEKTRVLELRKDHINAQTVSRMTKFLTKHSRMVPRTLEVRKVDNPTLHEANAWVFARYLLPV